MKAWQILGSPEAWIQGELAGLRKDGSVDVNRRPLDPESNCFCLVGAIMKKHGTPDYEDNVIKDCTILVKDLVAKGEIDSRGIHDALVYSLTCWNDLPSRKHVEVWDLLKRNDV